MFFMGQEYGSSHPFLYFSDQKGEIGDKVRKGRLSFLAQFCSICDTNEAAELIPDPTNPETFYRCKLAPEERTTKEAERQQAFFRDLLRLRREDPVIAQQHHGMLDGAVLSEECFLLRYFSGHGQTHRLLLVNLGLAFKLEHVPEPLIAPPEGTQWKMIWNSEQPEYGGSSVATPVTDTGWQISGPATILLEAITRF